MRARRFVVAAGASVTALALVASPAGAQGACSAAVNGTDISEYSSPKDALEVSADDVLTVTANAPGPGTYRVDIDLAGWSEWTAASGDYDGDSWQDEVVVDDYVDNIAGIYKVFAVSPEAGCSGHAYFRITGVSALSTIAGKASAGAAVLGLIGTVVGSALAARGGKVRKTYPSAPADAPAPPATAAPPPPPPPPPSSESNQPGEPSEEEWR
jgi:hypothetical protein